MCHFLIGWIQLIDEWSFTVISMLLKIAQYDNFIAVITTNRIKNFSLKLLASFNLTVDEPHGHQGNQMVLLDALCNF